MGAAMISGRLCSDGEEPALSGAEVPRLGGTELRHHTSQCQPLPDYSVLMRKNDVRQASFAD